MCGRFTLKANTSEVAARFGALPPSDIELSDRFNIAPSQAVPIVVAGDERPVLRWAQWGFRPAWLKDGGRRPPPINARAETLVEKPMFRGALGKGRCIIPATGFYEWRGAGSGRKQPWHPRLRDGALFGFAGLYAVADGEPGFAIVTTSANERVAPVHHRMPVILDPELEPLWLDAGVTEPAAALPCLRPYPAELMEAYPVSPAVGSVANDGPQLVLPLQ